ncbi:class I SAM-dependent methyltransferase [Kitasatospora sp. NPDC098663]|uniref:class I SAM-dependent methyltransferase n=1 Tax=Kitasatospora sp. NPDC098663 TaxID=3364096 RepID=UPI003827CA66
MWSGSSTLATHTLDANAVRTHPHCGPVDQAPRKYRGPHQLSRNGWANFAERLERSEEIATILSLTAGHARVLDVGGGTGELTRAVAAQIGKCTTVEPHRDRVAVLDAGGPAAAAVEVHPGRAEALPFADRSFDLVYTAWVLHYVQDLQQALEEIARVCDDTNPEATIVVVGGSPDNELVRLLNDVCVPIAGEQPDHQGFLLAEAARVFSDHGFSEFSLLRTEAALHFPEVSEPDRITAAAATLVDFWFEGHARAADMRRALEPALREHFARRPHAVGDQATVLVARAPRLDNPNTGTA